MPYPVHQSLPPSIQPPDHPTDRRLTCIWSGIHSSTRSWWRTAKTHPMWLTLTDTRYTTIELDLLAVVWAMMKSNFYLAGPQHFGLVTDNRPLVPILNSYFLDTINNPCLQRLKKISAFIFTANWRPGKEFCIAEAPSHSPVGKLTCEDDFLDAETSFCQMHHPTSCRVSGHRHQPWRFWALQQRSHGRVSSRSQRGPCLL